MALRFRGKSATGSAGEWRPGLRAAGRTWLPELAKDRRVLVRWILPAAVAAIGFHADGIPPRGLRHRRGRDQLATGPRCGPVIPVGAGRSGRRRGGGRRQRARCLSSFADILAR